MIVFLIFPVIRGQILTSLSCRKESSKDRESMGIALSFLLLLLAHVRILSIAEIVDYRSLKSPAWQNGRSTLVQRSEDGPSGQDMSQALLCRLPPWKKKVPDAAFLNRLRGGGSHESQGTLHALRCSMRQHGSDGLMLPFYLRV